MLAAALEFFLEYYFFGNLFFFRTVHLVGLILAIFGDFIRKSSMLWCGVGFSHLITYKRKTEHKLVRTGPYKYCRHPSYFGWALWSVSTQGTFLNFFEFHSFLNFFMNVYFWTFLWPFYLWTFLCTFIFELFYGRLFFNFVMDVYFLTFLWTFIFELFYERLFLNFCMNVYFSTLLWTFVFLLFYELLFLNVLMNFLFLNFLWTFLNFEINKNILVCLCNPICTIIFAISSFKFFEDRIPIEEFTLRQLFGAEYDQYRIEVPFSGIPFVDGTLRWVTKTNTNESAIIPDALFLSFLPNLIFKF